MPAEQSLSGHRIAVVEDDPVMGESLMVRLTLEGAEVRWWTKAEDAERSLPAFDPEVVICDIRLPALDGEELFQRLSRQISAPFLFMTAYSQIDQAVRLMRAGAADYVTKPFDFADLSSRLKRLLVPGGGALGPSAAMRRIEAQLERLADRPSIPVLLTGETGVGKQVCARFLHDAGTQTGAPGPFVVVDCAALAHPASAEALFGPGGLLSQASGGGTLFLDEVAELPLALQPRFLRLIEARSFQPAGGGAAQDFAGRIVCATHADLHARAREGLFRQDLLFRIDVAGIAVPPLRDRPEDILWLLQHFLAAAASAGGLPPPRVATGAEMIALQHDWPGNARELRNRIERAVALSGATLGPSDLFPELAAADDSFALLADTRDQAERLHIRRALARTGGNVPDAAVLMGVSRSTLFDKMRRLGLSRVED
ncbi:MAG: sigma-54-dependent transcriptional regulator [Pararhodobacter sp.]